MPSDRYLAFCAFLDADVYHPERWTAEQQRAYTVWRVGEFRHRWRRLMAQGYPALLRAQSSRQVLINQVREDLFEALRPPPTRLYEQCPCCPRPRLGGGGRPKGDPWNGDGVQRTLTLDDGGQRARAVAWLAATFGRAT